MPTTYEYKVRDRAGNLVSGQLIGDSEGPCLLAQHDEELIGAGSNAALDLEQVS